MTDLFTTADNIRKFAQQFKGVLDLADYIEEIGKLEQVKSEAESAADKARKEAADLYAENHAMQAKLTDMKVGADLILSNAKANADAICIAARRKADADAEEILKVANTKANDIVAKAMDSRAVMTEELVGLTASVNAGKAELAALEARKQEAEATTAAVEKKLADLQNKIKALAGL